MNGPTEFHVVGTLSEWEILSRLDVVERAGPAHQRPPRRGDARPGRRRSASASRRPSGCCSSSRATSPTRRSPTATWRCWPTSSPAPRPGAWRRRDAATRVAGAGRRARRSSAGVAAGSPGARGPHERRPAGGPRASGSSSRGRRSFRDRLRRAGRRRRSRPCGAWTSRSAAARPWRSSASPGSGKTTTARAILRLVEAAAGSVVFDGIDVRGRRIAPTCAACASGCRSCSRTRTRRSTRGSPSGRRCPRSCPSTGSAPRRPSGASASRPSSTDVGLGPRSPAGTRTSSPAASASGWASPAPSPWTRSCWSSTSRSPPSTSRSRRRSSTCSRTSSDARGLAYLFVAHDLAVVHHTADRIAVMYLGEIVEEGPIDAVFDHPRHPYTEALLAAIPGEGGAGWAQGGPRRASSGRTSATPPAARSGPAARCATTAATTTPPFVRLDGGAGEPLLAGDGPGVRRGRGGARPPDSTQATIRRRSHDRRRPISSSTRRPAHARLPPRSCAPGPRRRRRQSSGSRPAMSRTSASAVGESARGHRPGDVQPGHRPAVRRGCRAR